MKRRKNRLNILVKKIEGINKVIVNNKKYLEVRKYIDKKIKTEHGVYALYNKAGKLYYVGRASDIISRVRQHTKNRHSRQWSYFSIYFTKKKQDAHDVEAIILSVLPTVKGNKQNRSKLGEDKDLKKQIKKIKRYIDYERIKNIKRNPTFLNIGETKKEDKEKPKGRKNKERPNLKNYFKKLRPLKKEYRGRVYKAKLLKSGKIKYKGKSYDNPSAAAWAAIKRRSPSSRPNGWSFWSVKNYKNKWIKLSKLN